MPELPLFFAAKDKLESHVKICENKDFCNIVMPSQATKVLEFNQYQNSEKTLFIIYAELEFLLEKFDVCKTNPKISSTTKVKEHTPSGLSMSTISIGIENKNDVYRGKYCMKKDL